MKFHWPIFIVMILGFSLALCAASEVSAGPDESIVDIPKAAGEATGTDTGIFVDEGNGNVEITEPIGQGKEDMDAYRGYLQQKEMKDAIYSAPQANIGQEISQMVGGKEGQDIEETIMPPSDDDGYEY